MRDDGNDEPGTDGQPDPARGPTGSGPSSGRAAAEQDLKSTGDSIRADALRLATLEDDKLALVVSDPLVGRLSDDAVELADRISRQTRAERQLSEELG